jgi:hypothetical protein
MEVSKFLFADASAVLDANPVPTEGRSYWCVICQRLLPNDEGVIVHDDVPHPDEMAFDEEDRPQ